MTHGNTPPEQPGPYQDQPGPYGGYPPQGYSGQPTFEHPTQQYGGGYGQPGWQQSPPGYGPGGIIGGPPNNSNNTFIWLGIGGVAVLVVVILIAVFIIAGRDKPPPIGPVAQTSNPIEPPPSNAPPQTTGRFKPNDYFDWTSNSVFDKINSRDQDPKPLTIEEVYSGSARNPSYKHSLQLREHRLDTDCASTVWGEDLKSALVRYGCNQVIRGIYVDTTNTFVVQTAIFNLKDVASANGLVKDLDPKVDRGWFLPLAGAAPADKFGPGFTRGDGKAAGHFAAIVWAGRADGTESSTSELIPLVVVGGHVKDFVYRRN